MRYYDGYMSAPTYSFSKKEALTVGWQRFKERPLFLIGLFLLTTILSGITGFVADQVNAGAVGVALNLIDFAVQIILSMGITLIVLRVYDHVDTDYGDLLEPIHLFWKYLAMSILVLAIVLIGFVLFIVPGIIAGIALSFTSYLIIDRNLGPVEAIQESMRMTHGHRWNLFIFGLSIFLLNIIGALFLGFGLLVTIPISALAIVHVYRWLSHPPHERGITVSVVSKTTSVIALVFLLGVAALFAISVGDTGPAPAVPEARDIQRRADLVDVKLGAELYRDANGVYPETLDDLVPDYLDVVPTDPLTGEPYYYTIYADGTDYEVCTILETESDFGGEYCEFGLELGSGVTPEIDFGAADTEPLPIELTP